MKRLFLAALLCAAPLHAQSAGSAGKQVLQFNAGGRAAALAGAYTALSNDADALFYNPAGMATLRAAASASYETHTLDIAFGNAAAFTRFGHVNVGVGVAYLDAGTITEITPDPDYGGNIGIGTGQSVSASEAAGRLSIATTISRARIGVSGGFVSSSVANANDNAPFLDAGAQYDVGATTVALLFRNLGASDLPAEARAGAAHSFRFGSNYGVNASLDGVARIREGSMSAAAGMEAGLLPGPQNELGAVVRVGFDAEPNQLSAIRLGAGLSIRTLALDYAYQNLDFVGAVHRFGIRWSTR